MTECEALTDVAGVRSFSGLHLFWYAQNDTDAVQLRYEKIIAMASYGSNQNELLVC